MYRVADSHITMKADSIWLSHSNKCSSDVIASASFSYGADRVGFVHVEIALLDTPGEIRIDSCDE